MESLRYIDFGNGFVLLERKIQCSPQHGRLRAVNIQQYGDSNYILDKLKTIFIFNKDYSWLSFATQRQKKIIPVYNPEVQNVYIFGRLPKKCPILTATQATELTKLDKTDCLYRAAYVVAYSLLDNSDLELCCHVLQKLEHPSLSKYLSNAFTHNEMTKGLQILKSLVMDPTQKIELPTSDASLLDFLFNLMADKDACFFPFKDARYQNQKFQPDPNYPVYFHQFKWHNHELSLSALVNVPGIFTLQNPQHGVPHQITTCGVTAIHLIKNGIICYDTLLLCTDMPHKKETGYVNLIGYPLLDAKDLTLDLGLEQICELVRNRNLASIRHMCLSYLKAKSEMPTSMPNALQAHDSFFKKLNTTQKKYLESLGINESIGYWKNTKDKTIGYGFNVFDEHMELCIDRINIILKTYLSKKGFRGLKKYIDTTLLSFVDEMLSQLFDTLYKESNYFQALETQIAIAWKDLLSYDYLIQKIRFLLTYTDWHMEYKASDFFTITHDNSEFIFEFRDSSQGQYDYAH